MAEKKAEPLGRALRKSKPDGAQYENTFAFPALRPGKRRLRWGIEVEVESQASFSGDPYDLDTPSPWRAKGDGSLNNGVEFESPPFVSLKEGLDAVEMLDDFLEDKFDAEQTCGLHVHVDAQAFQTVTTQRSFCLNIGQLEYLFYSVLPRRRWNGTYSIPTLWIPPWQHRERFFGMNTVSRDVHNSFEFRYHSGSRDYHKIRAWVSMIWELYQLGAYRPTELTRLADTLIAKTAIGDNDSAIPDTLALMCDVVPNLKGFKKYWKQRYDIFGAKASHPARIHKDRYVVWRKAVSGVAASDAAARRVKAASAINEHSWIKKLPTRLRKEFSGAGSLILPEYLGVELIINSRDQRNGASLWEQNF